MKSAETGTLMKIYRLAERKWRGESYEPASIVVSEATTSTDKSSTNTRSTTPTFDAKVMCIICNKRWLKGKEPTSNISTISSQKSIIEKAKQLN